MKNSILILLFVSLLLSCEDKDPPKVSGCTNPLATNYNPDAEVDDGTCTIVGCLDQGAINYDANANVDSGECMYRKDLFIGTYRGNTECDNPLINALVDTQEVVFTITELPGENNKVTVEVEFDLEFLDQTPEGSIDENNVLTFEQEQRAIEVDVTMDGVPEILDVKTIGVFELDEAREVLSGDITIEVRDNATGVLFICSTCEAIANRE